MDNWLVYETVTYSHKVTAKTEEEAIKIVKGGGQGQDKTVNGVDFSSKVCTFTEILTSHAYQKSAFLLDLKINYD